ncbi:hypothetical protein T11_12699 [Trichinella zimbabwensis]|uniref:Uncharacterized protein n=1 Tax=Trichinella zimbabwensis TaxID=268475 RepID=A0A0V1G9X5_9BILA|nr:hypothetical protein T11_12699 [Trichinella zimbabwensis]
MGFQIDKQYNIYVPFLGLLLKKSPIHTDLPFFIITYN